MNSKVMVIFGGTGSLGRELIKRYKDSYVIVNFSRDECKQHEHSLEYGTNFNNYSCDIFNYDKVERGLLTWNPHILIICSAMKHIDACEADSEASINTNILGIKNILDCVERNLRWLTQIECVVMVSTDKACSSTNVYGACKFIAEKMTIERALRIPSIKFVTTRYGNVLNSRGSIIPYLHKAGELNKPYTITHPKMTRFAMTLEQSVDLIDYAIKFSPSGSITIPILPSMRIKDLFDIFSETYKKEVKVIGIKKGEKLHEDLVNSTEGRLARHTKDGKYVLIFPTEKLHAESDLEQYERIVYDSSMELMTKEELKCLLSSTKLL
jgi:UDP-glucose 4-epimerase